MKIVEPGVIKTDFGGRSFDFHNDESLAEYQPTVKRLFDSFAPSAQHASAPEVVADVIYSAVTNGSSQLRYTAGEYARQMIADREV